MKELQFNQFIIYFCESLFENVQGVLGRESYLDHGVFVLRDCNWVHSYFVKNVLILYFIDKNFNMVKGPDELLPFKFSSFVDSAKYVIESKRVLNNSDLVGISNKIKSYCMILPI